MVVRWVGLLARILMAHQVLLQPVAVEAEQILNQLLQEVVVQEL